MTSKECLNKIQHYINGTEITGKELIKCYETIYKDLDRLENAVEILNILKKYIYYDNKNHCIKMKQISEYTFSFDYEDLKEWYNK